MVLSLERKKIKKTGFAPAFFCGGIFAGTVPVLNMAVRHDIYTGMSGSAVNILLGANWQMMAMINVMLVVLGACIMYNTEFQDNAMQKINTLPVSKLGMFLAKAVLMIIMCTATLAIEIIGAAFCAYHWFPSAPVIKMELLKNFGYFWLMMIPAVFLALFIASICKNMWISLGIGVVCIFMATMLVTKSSLLGMFAFALPFKILTAQNTGLSLAAGAFQCVILTVAEFIIIKSEELR